VPAHLFVAHVPYTLILAGAALDLFGVVARDVRYRRWGGALLIAGAAAAMVAFFTGQAALGHAYARPSPDHARIDAHTQWGGAAVWLLAIGGGLRAAWRRRLDGVHGWVNLAAALVSALLILAITHSGLRIAHGG
jgi:uncharacterized membrane protein